MTRGGRPVLRVCAVVAAAILLSGPALAQERVLALQEAIETAFRLNPDLSVAREGEQAADARKGVAFAGYLPTLTGTAAYSRQTGNFTPRPGLIPSSFKLSTSPTNQSFNYFNFGLALQVPLYDFGRTGGANDAAQARHEAARWDLETAREAVWFAVVAQYFLVVAAQEMVEVARALDEQATAHAQRASAMVNAGLRPLIEAVRADAEAKAAQAARMQAENDLTVARASLLAAMGISEPFAFRAVSPEPEPQNPEELPPVEDAVRQALAARPEYASLRAQIEAQQAVVRTMRGQWFPSLSANASFSDAGTEMKNLVWNWSLGVMLSVPLFTGLAPMYQVREAEAALNALRERMRGFEVSVRREVEQARAQYQNALARLQPLEAAVAAAQEALALAQGRFETGTGTSVELLDARAALANALAARVRGRLDLALARASWSRVLGRAGFETARSPATEPRE